MLDDLEDEDVKVLREHGNTRVAAVEADLGALTRPLPTSIE